MKTISKEALKNVLKKNNLTTEDVDKYLGFSGCKNSLTQIVNYSANPIPANFNDKVEDFLHVHKITCNNLYAIYGSNKAEHGDIKAAERYNYDVIKAKAAKLGFNMATLSCFVANNKMMSKKSAELYISNVFNNNGNMNGKQINTLAALLETSTSGLQKFETNEKPLEFEGSCITDEYDISIFINSMLKVEEQKKLKEAIKISDKLWDKIKSGELKVNQFFIERFTNAMNQTFKTTFTVEDINTTASSSSKSYKEDSNKNDNIKTITNETKANTQGKEDIVSKESPKDKEEKKEGKEKSSKNKSSQSTNEMFNAYWSVFKAGYIEKKEFSKILNVTFSALDKLIEKKEQEEITANAIKKDDLLRAEQEEKKRKEKEKEQEEEIKSLQTKCKVLLDEYDEKEYELNILKESNSKLQKELKEEKKAREESVYFDELDSLTNKQLKNLILNTLLYAKNIISSEEMQEYANYTACLSKMIEVEENLLGNDETDN